MDKSSTRADESTTSTHGVDVGTIIAPSDAEHQDGKDADRSDAKQRTPGLKIFDLGLYPILTNFVVFAVSVAATYLTTHGNQQGGKVGKWFYERGNIFKREVMKLGMDEKQADASKMITFSFLDGSIMAPFIKMFEDRREHIAKKIDTRLGTLPEDDSAYDAEPKQSWGSVLGGRVVALSTVLPTAIVLGKVGTKDGQWIWNTVKDNPGFNSLNDHMFSNPGKALGEAIEKDPKIARYFGKTNIPVISSVAIFEAFYTSLCTAALYFSSRHIAKKKAQSTEQGVSDAAVVPAVTTAEDAPIADTDSKKRVNVPEEPKSYRDRYLAEKSLSPALVVQ